MCLTELLQASFFCREQFANDGNARGAAGGVATDMEHRLTRYELELMDVLWELGEGTVQDVCDRLERPLAYTTVMTTLTLLATKKHALERRKVGRAFSYRPLVTREEISRTMIADLREVLFGDHLPSLMLNLLSDETITPEDAQALRAALDRLEEER